MLDAALAEAEAAGMATDLSGDDQEAVGTGMAEVRLAQTRAALDVHRAAKATAAQCAAVLASRKLDATSLWLVRYREGTAPVDVLRLIEYP